MAILHVGATSPFHSIAAAMLSAAANDTIQLDSGYSNETAIITHGGMTVDGDATSTGIVLQLATGIAVFTTTGAAPFEIRDALDGNGIVGNAGDNVIAVSSGVDAVSGGLGTDRLVVDYHLATGPVTGDSTSNFTEAGGGGRTVTITNGTFANFTVLTGAAADTITTGAGDDVINAGDGANTITAGQGANSITGGADADTITALDGGNYIDGGDGTNVLTSGNGDDTITSGTGADTIVAGGGADRITVRGGADTVVAGAGNDRLIVDYSAMLTDVTGGITGGNLAAGYVGHIADLVAAVVDFTGTETFDITTGSGNDAITTGDGNDVLNGGAGNDTLDGGGGNDTLRGGAGNDSIDGGTGTDTLIYTGHASDYTTTDNLDGTFTIVDNRAGSPEGTDIVRGIETFAFNTPPTGAVSISGTPANGAVLTASSTLADADGLGTVTYQWQANGANLTGAVGSTLALTVAELGKAITVVGSYTDQLGTPESVVSLPTGAVIFGTTTPVVTSVVATPGSAVLGFTATATIALALNEVVTVDTTGGSPTLVLNNGAVATYVSGSGTSTLAFTYTVAPGQTTPDLSVTATQLNGATITDQAGTAADLTGAAANPAGILKIAAIAALNTTTHQVIGVVGTAYTGPVAGIEDQYINLTSDSLNIATATPNCFIHSGSGDDAISVSSGTNVVDGGSGSNFLAGGSGPDTFFADTRGASSDTWSTLVNFQAGDTATIWGVTPAEFHLDLVDNQGTAGYMGLTIHATAANTPTASLTFGGRTLADFNGGHISMTSGTDPISGSTYTSFHANL